MSDTARSLALAEVHNLYGRYAHALDAGDGASFTDCFTADAGLWPNTGPFQRDRGRFSPDAFAGFLSQTAAGRPRHIIVNVHAEVSADAARADATALFLLFDLKSGEILALGQYDDIAVKDADAVWRYREKRISFLWQSERYKARSEAMPSAGAKS